MFLIICLFVRLFVFCFFFVFFCFNQRIYIPLGKSKDCLYRPVLQECTLKFNCFSQSLYEPIRNRAESLFHLHLHHALFSLLYEIENAIYFIGQFPIECLKNKIQGYSKSQSEQR